MSYESRKCLFPRKRWYKCWLAVSDRGLFNKVEGNPFVYVFSNIWNLHGARCKEVVVVQLLSLAWLCNPMDCSMTVSLSSTNCQSLLRCMTIESVMLSNHPILFCPFLRLLSIFPSIRVFSNETFLHIRWPKCWSFSFSNSLSNECSGLIFFRIYGFESLQSKGLLRVFSCIIIWKHRLFGIKTS